MPRKKESWIRMIRSHFFIYFSINDFGKADKLDPERRLFTPFYTVSENYWEIRKETQLARLFIGWWLIL